MDLQNMYLSVKVDDKNGSIISINNGQREFVLQDSKNVPLFVIRLRNEDGTFADISSMLFKNCLVEKRVEENKKEITMNYTGLYELNISVNVTISMPVDQPMSYWKISMENNTGMYVDWIDFPGLIVPNDLTANGGNSVILWPAMEGVIIDDIDYRNHNMLKYQPIEYPNKGWEGYYPGPCPIQMMAYYNEKGGLYFAAHDNKFNVKGIEVYSDNGGIKLEYKLFPGAVKGSYKMEYDMVIGTFEGDWHNAADIYRDWREQSPDPELKKLINLKDALPSWMEESPVTVIYPVRGQMHMGDMSFNEDFYPFTNALPHFERLSTELDSMLMALPMQWEGTAPWAPPYVWPPLGGEKNFVDFVDGLHAQSNLAGIYCSGIGWTNNSGLTPEYTRKEQFDREQLIDVMCDSPEGDSPRSAICQEPIRSGYDMCPSNQFVHDVAVEEVSKIVKSGCDYVQFFDQNIGGASYFCYSKKHGHPPAPGPWQVDAMKNLIKVVNAEAEKMGKRVIVGCEAAAAEPYMPYLLFNDLRFEIDYFMGNPVPLYNYIYHEYVNNFMGNQNMVGGAIQLLKSPLNVLQRIAYSFTAGDMLSVVLADGGKIHWDWCTPWGIEKPDQESIKKLINSLNRWRRGPFKEFLRYGKMLKPYEIEGAYDIPMTLFNGNQLHVPSLMTSRWLDQQDRNTQVVVNYTEFEQEFTLKCNDFSISKAVVFKNSYMENKEEQEVNMELTMNIRPFSALFVEFI